MAQTIRHSSLQDKLPPTTFAGVNAPEPENETAEDPSLVDLIRDGGAGDTDGSGIAGNFAGGSEQVTHGDVMEWVGETLRDEAVTQAEAAAIQSAEAHALEEPGGPPGGVGAAARSAADRNAARGDEASDKPITMGEVLHDVKSRLERHTVVSYADAVSVDNAEARHNPNPKEERLGMGAAEVAAATING